MAVHMSFLPREPAARALALGFVVNSFGTGLYTSTFALYFVGHLGLPPAQVGLVATASAIAALVVLPVVGVMLDRLSVAGLATTLLCLEAAGMVWLFLSTSVESFAVGTVVAAMAAQGSRVSRGVLTARVAAPAHRGTVRAQLRSCANLGIAMGAGAAALAVVLLPPSDLRWLFVANALTFLCLGGVYVRRLGHHGVVAPATSSTSHRTTGGVRVAWTDFRYVTVMGMNGLMGLQYAALTIGVPVLVSTQPGAPAWLVPATLIVNTAVIVILQAPASGLVTGPRTAGRAVLAGGAVLAVSSSLLAVGHVTTSEGALVVLVLVVAVVHSFGELLQVAGAFDLSYDLAHPDFTGSYQAVHAWTAGAGSALGPGVWSVAVVPTTSWLAPVVGAVFLVSGATTWMLTRGLPGQTTRAP